MTPDDIIFPTDDPPAEARGGRVLEEFDASTPEGMAAYQAIGHGADRAPDHLVHWRMIVPWQRPVMVRAVRHVLRSARSRGRRLRARRRSTASRAGPDPGEPHPAGLALAVRDHIGHVARPPPGLLVLAICNYEGVAMSRAVTKTPREEYLTPEEVAERYKVEREQVLRWMRMGWLEYVQLPRGRRVPVSALEAFLEDRPWAA